MPNYTHRAEQRQSSPSVLRILYTPGIISRRLVFFLRSSRATPSILSLKQVCPLPHFPHPSGPALLQASCPAQFTKSVVIVAYTCGSAECAHKGDPFGCILVGLFFSM